MATGLGPVPVFAAAGDIVLRRALAKQSAHAALLCGLLILFRLGAAHLRYTLFPGLNPVPEAVATLADAFTTLRGWALIATGPLVSGLFAAFAFAISVFSIPPLGWQSTWHAHLASVGKRA